MDTKALLSYDSGEDTLTFPNALARRISQKYVISEDAAMTCLIAFNWDEHELISAFDLSKEDAYRKCGYIGDCEPTSKLASCVICTEKIMSTQYGCGHYYCDKCLSGYCRNLVKHGNGLVVCASRECNMVIPLRVVRQKIGTDLKFHLETMTLRKLVASRKDITWCPYELCSCLISHENYPKDKTFNCLLCKGEIWINDNGKGVCVGEEAPKPEEKKIRRWWMTNDYYG